MILTLMQTKGGAGKTTTAFLAAASLARSGQDVALVDCDDPTAGGTSSYLMGLRAAYYEELGIPDPHPWTLAQLAGPTLKPQVQRLAQKHDHIIIDVGARASTDMMSALGAADIALIPPRPLELAAAIQDAIPLALQSRGKSGKPSRILAFLSCADAQGDDNAAAAAGLREIEGIEYIDAPLTRRKAFSNGFNDGLAPWEAKHPDGKAVNEIRYLTNLIFNIQ